MPIIDSRELWKGEKTRAVDAEQADVFVYDEKGQLYCIDPVQGESRELAFAGFESERRTLKYRCPAAAFGCDCRGRELCEQGRQVSAFGRTLRVPLDLDRRIFTPVARHTEKWKKAYRRRTAVERVNSRIDRVLGFELHFIRGMAKMKARVSIALIALLAMALGRLRVGDEQNLRSMLRPVSRAA